MYYNPVAEYNQRSFAPEGISQGNFLVRRRRTISPARNTIHDAYEQAAQLNKRAQDASQMVYKRAQDESRIMYKRAFANAFAKWLVNGVIIKLFVYLKNKTDFSMFKEGLSRGYKILSNLYFRINNALMVDVTYQKFIFKINIQSIYLLLYIALGFNIFTAQ